MTHLSRLDRMPQWQAALRTRAEGRPRGFHGITRVATPQETRRQLWPQLYRLRRRKIVLRGGMHAS